MERPSPNASYDVKARYLRWLYREMNRGARRREIQGDRVYPAVLHEYRHLFEEGRRDVSLDRILVNVWIEARELAGWTYDRTIQCYRRADGSRVIVDDGSEWAHL